MLLKAETVNLAVSVELPLLVVDVQRSFTELCPNELPVPGGAGIVPRVNALLALPFARVDATQDWHPPNHRSFLGRADNLYPPHCVMGTPGAEFLPGVHTQRFSAIWRKGYDPDFEAYAITAQHPAFAAFLYLLTDHDWDDRIIRRHQAILAGVAGPDRLADSAVHENGAIDG